MEKYTRLHKIVSWVLILTMCSLQAESTQDTFQDLPPPTKKSHWKASTFAGCALLAVVGGIFAICWSGGGQTPKNRHRNNNQCNDSFSTCGNSICPNTITADCMAGSCLYHHAHPQRDACSREEHRNVDNNVPCCNAPCEIFQNTPPCAFNSGGVPPF